MIGLSSALPGQGAAPSTALGVPYHMKSPSPGFAGSGHRIPAAQSAETGGTQPRISAAHSAADKNRLRRGLARWRTVGEIIPDCERNTVPFSCCVAAAPQSHGPRNARGQRRRSLSGRPIALKPYRPTPLTESETRTRRLFLCGSAWVLQPCRKSTGELFNNEAVSVLCLQSQISYYYYYVFLF